MMVGHKESRCIRHDDSSDLEIHDDSSDLEITNSMTKTVPYVSRSTWNCKEMGPS